jgi:hypothetical protein
MPAEVRVNVHPRPNHQNWDLHIPYQGNSYDQKKHVEQSYLKKFLDRIPTSDRIILVSNGEPSSRQIAVNHILSKKYQSVAIETIKACYDQPDLLFQDRHFLTIPRPPGLDDKQVIDYYLKHYRQMSRFSRRYDYEYHSRDHGYFSAVKRSWYQFGDDMPEAPDVFHSEMYVRLRQVFELLVDLLTNIPLSLPTQRIRKNLMLRLNHNPPNSEIDGFLTPRHADNSIVTLWLYQNSLGGKIDRGQQSPINEIAINDLYDPNKEIIMFPGFDYCDQQQTMTPATWHSVIDHSNNDRASLVAFLKY